MRDYVIKEERAAKGKAVKNPVKRAMAEYTMVCEDSFDEEEESKRLPRTVM